MVVGGRVACWTPEVAFVMWKRILGCLGNVNHIKDPVIHDTVYNYLGDLLTVLIQVRISILFKCVQYCFMW